MIEAYREESLALKITNNSEVDEVGLFLDVMKKCEAESKKKGFRNLFSSEERAFIKEFTAKLLVE